MTLHLTIITSYCSVGKEFAINARVTAFDSWVREDPLGGGILSPSILDLPLWPSLVKNPPERQRPGSDPWPVKTWAWEKGAYPPDAIRPRIAVNK